MAESPEISVVMGVFNNAATLSAALDSILSQADVGLEFIVVDDGSTDGSAKILDAAAKRDPRLKVVHKKNEGLTRALIDGCALASAPWIARQDADDVSLPGRLKAQLNRARQEDVPVLVGCGALTLGPGGETLDVHRPPADVAAASRRVREDGQAISPHGSILFRRDAYERAGGYRAEFYCAQDIDLTMRLAEIGPVAAVPAVRFEYRLSPTAISGRYGTFQRAFYRLVRRAAELRRRGQPEDRLLAQAERLRRKCRHARKTDVSNFGFYYYVGSRLAADQPGQAAGYFRRAWALRPWSAKAWLRWRQALRRAGRRGMR